MIFFKGFFGKLFRDSVYSNSVTVIEQLLTLQTLTYFSTLHIFLLTIRVRTLGKIANMLLLLFSIINRCAHRLY